MSNKKISRPVIFVGIIFIIIFILVGGIIASCMFFTNYTSAKKELFIAIKENDIAAVSEIIEKYPSLVNCERNLIGIFGNSTPLITAIARGHDDIAKLLIENNANVNKLCYSSPIIEAVARGNYDMAWYLIEKGADVTVVDSTSQKRTFIFSLVSWRIKEGDEEREKEQFELFKYALEQGATIEPSRARYLGISNVLGLAACYNNRLIVEYVLDQNMYDIDGRVTETDKTPLICATQQQSYNTCEVLIQRGADLSLKDSYGKTAHDYAVELNDERLINILSEQ